MAAATMLPATARPFSSQMVMFRFLVRHENRNGHAAKHLSCDAAKNGLLKARMPITTHDQQIEAFIRGDREDTRLHVASVHLQGNGLCRQPIAGEMFPKPVG